MLHNGYQFLSHFIFKLYISSLVNFNYLRDEKCPKCILANIQVLAWSRLNISGTKNCLHFRNTWFHTRLMGFVLSNHFFSIEFCPFFFWLLYLSVFLRATAFGDPFWYLQNIFFYFLLEHQVWKNHRLLRSVFILAYRKCPIDLCMGFN